MQLKQYQVETLAVLRRFFEEARMAGPKNAYETITTEPDSADRLGRYGGRYSAPLADLPNVPYVSCACRPVAARPSWALTPLRWHATPG